MFHSNIIWYSIRHIGSNKEHSHSKIIILPIFDYKFFKKKYYFQKILKNIRKYKNQSYNNFFKIFIQNNKPNQKKKYFQNLGYYI